MSREMEWVTIGRPRTPLPPWEDIPYLWRTGDLCELIRKVFTSHGISLSNSEDYSRVSRIAASVDNGDYGVDNPKAWWVICIDEIPALRFYGYTCVQASRETWQKIHDAGLEEWGFSDKEKSKETAT